MSIKRIKDTQLVKAKSSVTIVNRHTLGLICVRQPRLLMVQMLGIETKINEFIMN